MYFRDFFHYTKFLANNELNELNLNKGPRILINLKLRFILGTLLIPLSLRISQLTDNLKKKLKAIAYSILNNFQKDQVVEIFLYGSNCMIHFFGLTNILRCM